MNISVIICAYTLQRWQTLVDGIISVQQQTLAPMEILAVIDNNAELAVHLRERFPEIRVLEHVGLRGLSQARNRGIVEARGEILAFLDDDAIAEPDWLDRLCQPYQDPRVLGVGGYASSSWQGQRPAWFPEEFEWVVGCSYRGLPRKTAPVRNFIGCNMSFRREILLSVQGFHQDLGRINALPVGCEETELCIRIQREYADGILLYEPTARVLHQVAQSREKARYFFSRCFFEGRSKAKVAQLVGTQDGLSSERSYTLQTLPSGMLHGLWDSVVHGNSAGVARAGSIAAGLLCTTLGYVSGKLALQKNVQRSIETSEPLKTDELANIRTSVARLVA